MLIECSRCVMNSTVVDLILDEKGICNYCSEFEERSNLVQLRNGTSSSDLTDFLEKVKRNGKGKKYDCIIGVSGGVDSSFVLIEAVRLGLRPLAVHMDNGWNSELAQNNISNIVSKLGIDLYTHVIDWEEYRSLLGSFLDSDVIDIELLYDNAMLSVNYRLAQKFNLKYILSGSNQATEGMRMPKSWSWLKFDSRNIKGINRKFNNIRIKSFPLISIWNYAYASLVRRIEWVPFLDYMDYNKESALIELESKFNFKRYPYKHYESIFTRFYQGFILPTKFGVDKRIIHLSTLIMTNQISRHEAKLILTSEPYESKEKLEEDYKYFLKKMNITKEEFMIYLSRPEISHDSYASSIRLWRFIKNNVK